MRPFTVNVEHDGPNGRELTDVAVMAESFDDAVASAKVQFAYPVIMSVEMHPTQDVTEQDLFEEFSK